MVDAEDSKSSARKGVGVRIPPPAPGFVLGLDENEACHGVAPSEAGLLFHLVHTENYALASQPSFLTKERTKPVTA